MVVFSLRGPHVEILTVCVAVIQGNLETMVDGVYSADEAHLTPILEEARALSPMIDDLRTFTLAESGALELQREATDLAVLVGAVVAAFRSQAEAAGVTLQAEATLDIPWWTSILCASARS